MGTEICFAIHEGSAVRKSEMTMGQREGITLNLAGKNYFRKALSNLLVMVSSFLF